MVVLNHVLTANIAAEYKDMQNYKSYFTYTMYVSTDENVKIKSKIKSLLKV
jgi:hypothetical protein